RRAAPLAAGEGEALLHEERERAIVDVGAAKDFGGSDRRRVTMRVAGKLGMSRVLDVHSRSGAHRHADRVMKTGDRAPENVETRPEVADAARRDGADGCFSVDQEPVRGMI